MCWLLRISVLKIRKETTNKNLSRHLLHVETQGKGTGRDIIPLIFGTDIRSSQHSLGTQADLTLALQRMGFSGRLNTAFIERVNLSVRHGVAALARRTWATSQQAPQLLAHVEWWRASYHFVRPHAALRVALVQPRERGGKLMMQRYRQRTEADGSRENKSTLDGARGALLPLATGSRLRATQARCGGSVMPWGRPVNVPGEAVGWGLTSG